MPGDGAAVASELPLFGGGYSALAVEGKRAGAESTGVVDVGAVSTSPGFFSVLGTALLAGRDFDGRGGASGEPVAIVNEMLAREYFPGEIRSVRECGCGTRRWPIRTLGRRWLALSGTRSTAA